MRCFICSDSRLISTCAIACLAVMLCTGCGTTRITDTSRTATEQLLISGAIDQAVDGIECQPLVGKSIYFDVDLSRPTDDQRYLIDTVRQKLLASGCTLKEKKTDADLIVNLRVGVVGTDSNQMIFGVPSVNVPPALTALSSAPMSIPTIPEVPLATKKAQRGVAKIGLFAYDQETGRAVWQSGATPIASTAKEVWLLGAGPWQWGTIYDQPKFAGSNVPLAGLFRGSRSTSVDEDAPISVASSAVFDSASGEPLNVEATAGKVMLASHAEPEKPASSAGATPPAAKPGTTPAPKPAAEPAAATPPAKPPATPAPAGPPPEPAAAPPAASASAEPPAQADPSQNQPDSNQEPGKLPADVATAAKLQPAASGGEPPATAADIPPPASDRAAGEAK